MVSGGATFTDRDLKEDYKIESVIGQGNYSKVRRGRNKATGEKVAIKIISKSKLSPEDLADLKNEIDILKQVDHPNIVKLIDVYEDAKNFSLVMELMRGGELFDVLMEREQFSEKEARDIIAPIIDAINYLHSLGIIHRDIKPENLLFSSKDIETAVIKVADFGFARFVQEEDKDGLATTVCGTPNYVAPEVLEQKPYGTPCDSWSIGVVLYILLCGCPPFSGDDENHFQLFQNIIKCEYDFSHETWEHVSQSPKDLIKNLLVFEPSKRLTPAQLLQHPWITGENLEKKDIKVMSKMKEWNSKRQLA